jgi:glycosyltransferase involved in cell wall biosynthesis
MTNQLVGMRDSLFRLVVDDSAAFNQGAGIGRYARNIVPSLFRNLLNTKLTLWYAPAQASEAPFAAATTDMFRGLVAPHVRRGPLSRRRMDQLWFRARLPLPLRLLAGRADLIYSPDFTAPPDGRTPTIATVHDLAFLVCPERAPAPLRRYLEAVVPAQVARVAKIVAVSETTRRDLVHRLGVDASRIAVVPNGVDETFLSAVPLAADERSLLGLPASYLLTVGTIEPRKNHLTLFEALTYLEKRVDLPLVVAGRRGWDYEPILRAAEPLASRGRVILLDYVPEELLPGLYAGAAAVIYASWYEGFGLPVIEAMAAGSPVVASDIPALREVGDGAALYAPPASAEALANAIELALRADERTPDVQAARRRQARRFRWDESGRKLASVIADVADRPDLLLSVTGSL